jgi:hypothetical protein
VDRSIRIVLQLDQNFEPYRIMFKELKGKWQLTSQRFCKEMVVPQNIKILFFEGGLQFFKDYCFS